MTGRVWTVLGVLWWTAMLLAVLTGIAPARPCWGEPSAVPVRHAYRWAEVEGEPLNRILYRDGRHAGYWDGATGKYYPWQNGRYRSAVKPPRKPPVVAVPVAFADREAWEVSGVEEGKIAPTPSCTLNGKAVPYSMAPALAGGTDVPDDGGKPWLLVFSDDAAQRKRVLDDIDTAPELRFVRDNFRVQAYSRKDPLLSHYNHDTTGSPGIVAQRVNQEVSWHQWNYEGGAKALAENLARVHPEYDPKKDPNPNTPVTEKPWLYLGLGGAALLLLVKRS